MANKIDLIVKYSTEAFDEVYAAESRSSLLDGNKKLMQFTGAKTVKVAKFSAGGLYDYQRANTETSGKFSNGTHAGTGYGYQNADMGVTWEEFTLSCDRAAQYRVELFDNEETAQMAVGLGTTEINRTVVIPEIDAYCFSKIASFADVGNLVSSTITEPLAALNDALLWFDNHEVAPENQIIFCSPRFMQSLRNTSANGLVKPLMQGADFKNVKFTIEEYEGRKIVPVPPRRFLTNINLFAGGFGPSSASQEIDFMVVAKDAIYHIVKYNKIKVFGPDVVQDYDGYKVNARVYHDVFVPDNKKVGIYVHVGGFTGASADVKAKVVATSVAGSGDSATVINAITLPGSILTAKYVLAASETALGSKISNGTDVVLGGDTTYASGAAYIHAVNADGVVVASGAITIVSNEE